MSAPVQDVYSRLYEGKRAITKHQPVIYSAPLETTSKNVFARLYRPPTTVKFPRSDFQANLKPKQLQPLFKKVGDPETSKKGKNGANHSKFDSHKQKNQGKKVKETLKKSEKATQKPNSKVEGAKPKNVIKVAEENAKDALKGVEKEAQKQKSNKLDGKKYKNALKNAEIELQQQKSKLDEKKYKNALKDAEIEPQEQKSKLDEKKYKNSLKNAESELQQQKSKLDEKKYKNALKDAESELQQPKSRFEGEKYKKVLKNPQTESQKLKNKLDEINEDILNHPGSELQKQEKAVVVEKMKSEDSSNSNRGKLAAETETAEDKLGEKPFVVLSVIERINPFRIALDKKKSKVAEKSDADGNEENEKESDANSKDDMQLFGVYQPHKISKENLKLRDEILDENRRSGLSYMQGDDQLPVPVNLENSQNTPVWNDDYYMKDEDEPKGKLSQPVWYNPPVPPKERHRAGQDSGRKTDNTIFGVRKGSFKVKDQTSASSNAKIREVDLDKDNSGVYRAKMRRDSQAQMINENTEVDLPLDDLSADEIEDEEIIPMIRQPQQARQLQQKSW